MPGAKAAHAQPGQVNAARVDIQRINRLGDQVIQHRQEIRPPVIFGALRRDGHKRQAALLDHARDAVRLH